MFLVVSMWHPMDAEPPVPARRHHGKAGSPEIAAMQIPRRRLIDKISQEIVTKTRITFLALRIQSLIDETSRC